MMIEWILIGLLFIWNFILTAIVLGLNMVQDAHEGVLYVLRDEINNLKFGEKDD